MSFLTRNRKPAAIFAGGFLASTAIAGSVAYAAIPASDGTISACYATSDAPKPVLNVVIGGTAPAYSKGDIRLVQPGEACRSYEMPVSWNQKGVPGQVGSPGVSGLHTVTASAQADWTSGGLYVVDVKCDAGEKLLSLGYRIQHIVPGDTFEGENGDLVGIRAVRPLEDWGYVAYSFLPGKLKTGEKARVTAYGKCAKVSP